MILLTRLTLLGGSSLMIELAQIARQYQNAFTQKYATQMKGVHHQALTQIMACHTPQAGAMLYHCDDC
jgi:hypothetical protein